jgi:hypothetical protein
MLLYFSFFVREDNINLVYYHNMFTIGLRDIDTNDKEFFEITILWKALRKYM